MKGTVSLAIWLAASLAAGWIGSQFVPGAWYESLVKPAWTPPNSVFAPVWTSLYIMMGIAAWLVWRRRMVARVTIPLSLFAVQLILNSVWSYVFFGLHRPGAAFFEILVLWAAILITLIRFWQIRTLAGILMLPYYVWVSFASVLNFQLWRLNM